MYLFRRVSSSRALLCEERLNNDWTAMTTVTELLDRARLSQQAGNLAQAERLCRQVLQTHPHQVDALYLLGVIAFQVGRLDLVPEYLGPAVHLNPDLVEGHNLLGVALAM